MPQDTHCCCEADTPRVRTIFRKRVESPAPPTSATSDVPQEPRNDWPSLVEAILNALLPFHDAWQAARQVIRQARDRTPVPA